MEPGDTADEENQTRKTFRFLLCCTLDLTLPFEDRDYHLYLSACPVWTTNSLLSKARERTGAAHRQPNPQRPRPRSPSLHGGAVLCFGWVGGLQSISRKKLVIRKVHYRVTHIYRLDALLRKVRSK